MVHVGTRLTYSFGTPHNMPPAFFLVIAILLLPIGLLIIWYGFEFTFITLPLTVFVLAIAFGLMNLVMRLQAVIKADYFRRVTYPKKYREWLGAARTDHALTCRTCGELAFPILGTRNRYRCNKCERQFAAATHNLKELS